VAVRPRPTVRLVSCRRLRVTSARQGTSTSTAPRSASLFRGIALREEAQAVAVAQIAHDEPAHAFAMCVEQFGNLRIGILSSVAMTTKMRTQSNSA